MTLAMLAYFVIFFGTIFSKRTSEPALQFPVAETYHDEDVPAVQNFKPWIIGALIMLLIAYAIPIAEVLNGNFGKSRGYHTDSPK